MARIQSGESPCTRCGNSRTSVSFIVRSHMAGLPRTTIAFAATPPQLESIGSLVQSRGGLPVEAWMENAALRLHFVCCPEGEGEVEVRARSDKGSGLVVTDWTLLGGTLYRLVCKVLVEAGGASTVDWGESLHLPLTEAALKRERRRISVAIALFVLVLALIAIAIGIVAGVAFVLWMIG